MDQSGLRDDEFAKSIAPWVLEVLTKFRFFELLDDRLCPPDSSQAPAKCHHSFAVSREILRALEMDSEAIADALAVLSARGAYCDCEVLYNVAEESRLKANYWKQRTSEIERDRRHHPDPRGR